MKPIDRCTLALITFFVVVPGVSQSAKACDHSNMQQCLNCGNAQCDKNEENQSKFIDCIDFTINECEEVYLPSPSSQLATNEVKRTKALTQSFRAKAIQKWRIKQQRNR